MTDRQSVFWDDLARDLEDPEFLRDYVVESVRIATVDGVINALDEAREAAGLSKADVARAINSNPAAVRRMLSSGRANPTLGTLAEIAAALGLRITVEPMADTEQKMITGPLCSGHTDSPRALAKAGERARRGKQRALTGG
jgi:transcriptional regulator with XRE-family HTH domain